VTIDLTRVTPGVWSARASPSCWLLPFPPLRAGFLTSASEHGASTFKMQEVSRHKSVDVLASSVRRSDQFKGHAGSGFL
jgi:hypothetical protein